MTKQTDTSALVRPYGDVEEVNRLSRLFSEQKAKGNLDGYSFQLPGDASLTVGSAARELRIVYEGHLAGRTSEVTDEVLAGEY